MPPGESTYLLVASLTLLLALALSTIVGAIRMQRVSAGIYFTAGAVLATLVLFALTWFLVTPGMIVGLWSIAAALFMCRGVPVPANRHVDDEIYEVSNGLFANLLQNSGDNVYFVSAARDLFVALLTAMLREGETRTNADIRHGIGSMSVPDMHELLDRPGNEDLRGAKHYIAREGSPSTGATVAFMQQVIQESFRSDFGRAGDFSIRQFLRDKGGRALFLEYDIASGTMLGPVYKTMLDIAMKEAMSRTRAAGRVVFVLDEFALLPELTHLTNELNFGRSLGLRFIVGTQNIKQVEAMYGPEMAMSVLSAFGTVFSFRLFDGPSRDFVRDRFGRNQKILRFESQVRAKGLNESVVDGYVVEDWDLSALPVGTCVAASPETPPVRFSFAYP